MKADKKEVKDLTPEEARDRIIHLLSSSEKGKLKEIVEKIASVVTLEPIGGRYFAVVALEGDSPIGLGVQFVKTGNPLPAKFLDGINKNGDCTGEKETGEEDADEDDDLWSDCSLCKDLTPNGVASAIFNIATSDH